MTDDGPNTYTYSQAALRGEATFVVDGDQLRKDGDDGWSLRFGDVTAATYTIIGTKTGATRELLLEADEPRKLIYVGPGGDNADNATFRALCKDVGKGLHAAQPGFEIVRGFAKGPRRWMFAASLFSIAVALSLGVAMMLAGVSTDILIAQSFPLIGLLLFGAWGAWSYSPTRKPSTIKAQYFPQG
ncbi:hypothetical protein [Yoonia sp. 208BN28-4]|uniref:hypothetical protein n=1 Tax=Yoonia sp. 208BN28-4 TaxID=3126505 RepID=UPI0030AB824E